MFSVLLGMFLLLTATVASAQSALPQQAPPPSCEAQLEEARNINVQLRKAKAQSDFTSATVEEAATAMQKRITEMEAKTKAAEAKPAEKKATEKK